MNKGLAAAIGAFLLWGVAPIFWKLLESVSALEINAHRMVWCCAFVSLILLARGGGAWISDLLRRPRVLLALSGSALLIGSNWFVYIWAVTNEHIVEASLGYFINPLIKMVLGTLIFKERLSRPQWLAVALAVCGVLYLTVQHGTLPWIGLTLAFSFAFYGVIRKLTDVSAMVGVAFESFVFVPVSLAYIIWLLGTGEGIFIGSGFKLSLLLAIGGIVTAVPLMLFAMAARNVAFATIGIVQFLAPSIQLLIAVVLYHEPFRQIELIGFSFIWAGVALYAADALLRQRRLHRYQVADPGVRPD